jgi:hypothetical protein
MWNKSDNFVNRIIAATLAAMAAMAAAGAVVGYLL